jgi:hypothetical protein
VCTGFAVFMFEVMGFNDVAVIFDILVAPAMTTAVFSSAVAKIFLTVIPILFLRTLYIRRLASA